jgi:TPR repeat protein
MKQRTTLGAPFLALALLLLIVAGCARGYSTATGDELTTGQLEDVLTAIAYGEAPIAGRWVKRLGEICRAGYPDVCGVHAFALAFTEPGSRNQQIALARAEIATNRFGAVAQGYDLAYRAGKWRAAMPYFETACRRNLLLGCTYYGSLVLEHAPPGNPNRAVGLDVLRSACRAGEGLGCHRLATALTADGQDAKSLFSKACKLGYPPGCAGHN